MTKTELNRVAGVFGSGGYQVIGEPDRPGRVKIRWCAQGHRIDEHNTIIERKRRCCLICFREKHPGHLLLATQPPAPTTRCSHGAFGYCALCERALCERAQANNGTRVEL